MLSWEYPPGAAGGMAAHVDGLSRAMASAGHDVVLFTRTNPSCAVDEVNNGVRVVRADVDMPWLPGRGRGGRARHPPTTPSSGDSAWLGDWVPDIVHAHDWAVGWAADVLATAVRCPARHDLARHRTGPPRRSPAGRERRPTSTAVEWWLAFRSRRVITSTRLMVREIIGGFELDPDVVSRIPHGIDPAWWARARAPTSRDDRRDTHERSCHVGAGAVREGLPRCSPGRWPSLRARVPGIVCMIAGRGTYLPELQSQIDLDGVGNIDASSPGSCPTTSCGRRSTAPTASSSRRCTSRSGWWRSKRSPPTPP